MSFCCSSCCPCPCHCFRRASAKASVVLRWVLALGSSCVCSVARRARGAPVPLSAGHKLSIGFSTLLFFSQAFIFSLINFLPPLAASWTTEGKFPVTATAPQWWEFLSYKTVLFIRLLWIVISAKPFKASVACKDYSAVFLSLWISKDKTAIRVKRPARLGADWCWIPREGVEGGLGQQELILTVVSAEALVKDALCPQAVDVPKV